MQSIATHHVTNVLQGGLMCRENFFVSLETIEGQVALYFERAKLEILIALLHELEQRSSLLDPKHGPIPGELVEVRLRRVDSIEVAAGRLNDAPIVILQSSCSGSVPQTWGLTHVQAGEAIDRMGAILEGQKSWPGAAS